MNILKTNNISKKYGNQFAVKDVNMVINHGDVYGFIGENGAGKTTLIRLITGLANPTSGSYELFGISDKSPDIYKAKKKVSAIVETPALYLNKSAYKNLLIQCNLLGIKDVSIIDSILDTVGLSYLRDVKKNVKNFSMGMKQRLGIAIALIGNPEFMLLDEPMNGLDPEGIVDIRELIIKLNREKKISFLVSSHNLSELSKIVTKYGFIHHGELIKEITTHDLASECKKWTELVVSEINNDVFSSIFKRFKVINNNTIYVYDDLDISDIVSKLKLENINIHSLNKKEESIEDYYLNLLGGKRHG